MGAREIAEKIGRHLRRDGVDIELTARDGGWTNPSHITFDLNGEHHVLQFWTDVSTDPVIEERLLLDIQNVLTSPARR